MKPILILAALALSGCMQLPGLLPLLPTPAQICAMSPDTRAAIVDLWGGKVADMAAACEIAG